MQLLSVDDSVGKSRHILGSMNQRMSQHKWIILTVIAVLVLAIALIVYVKMHSKRS
jgi:vesicle transport through interaction with t-SNAREs protein 1